MLLGVHWDWAGQCLVRVFDAAGQAKKEALATSKIKRQRGINRLDSGTFVFENRLTSRLIAWCSAVSELLSSSVYREISTLPGYMPGLLYGDISNWLDPSLSLPANRLDLRIGGSDLPNS